jgi:hypothetical protein
MAHFPAPWRSERVPGGYAVRDARGRIVAHVFGQDEPWKSTKVSLLTMEEAKEMALNIAKAGAVLSECFKGSSLRLQAVA